MKCIQMLGTIDKSDLILYISKVLAEVGKKVLLVDGTLDKKLQYSIHIEGEQKITEFEGFDISLSFTSYESIVDYVNHMKNDKYDILLVDTDDPSFINHEQYLLAHKRYFVTNYDRLCIEGNLRLMSGINSTEEKPSYVEVERIILNSVECGIDENYLNMQFANHNILWPEESFFLPIDEVDYALKIGNQHNKRISLRRLSRPYRALLEGVIQQILDCDTRYARTAVKQAQRRG